MRRISRSRLSRANVIYGLAVLLFMVAVIVQYTRFVAEAAVTHTPAAVTTISAGGATSSGVSCDIAVGAVYCWGDNNYGQLGNNSTKASSIPVAVNTSGVLSSKTITAIAVGEESICALAAGAVYCWGYNSNGQLGNNSTTNSLIPVAVDTSGVLAGKTVTAISVGGNFACALAAGAVYCWGSNSSGQLGNNSTTDSHVPVAVSTAGSVTAISLGSDSACAIIAGADYCWGDGQSGQLGNNSTTDSHVPVAVYTDPGGKVKGATVPPSPLYGKTVTAISIGLMSGCAVASGAAYCWGIDNYGELGDGGIMQSNVPVAVSTAGVLSGKTVSTVTGGGNYNCAVASGAAYCWGANTTGQLGNNSTAQSNVPVAVSTAGVLSGKTVTAVDAGMSDACAVASGAAYCWGANTYGALGNNSTVQSNVPVAVSPILIAGTEPVSNTASGLFANADSLQPGIPLASTNQPATLHAGGDAFRLRTGIYNSLQATNNLTFTDISGGTDHFCAVASGAAECWGNNINGGLGNNSTTQSLVPVAVDTSGVFASKTVTAISASQGFTCAVASGAAYCWGNNVNGQLGNNSTTQSLVPVAVDTSGVLSGKTVTAIATGTDFTCAVASGAAYCWGNNVNGQLGNNSTTQSLVPVAVDTSGVFASKTVTAISASQGFTCAVASGAAYCWGQNPDGRLGNNTTVESHTPVAVNTSGVLAGKTITFISAGNTHTCAVASGGAYCWGAQSNNDLGNNSGTNSSVPVAVDTSGALAGKTVTTTAAGPSHTCVVASGAAYCWGYSYYVATGNNNSTTPALVNATGVLAGKSITTITTGTTSTCVIGSNALYCWGSNSNGQLGNNSTVDSGVPVAVNVPGTPTPNSASLRANDNPFSLQYAQKTAATCSAQTTGFMNVSTNTTIAWNTNSSVTNGSVITANANDPTAAADTVYQTYVSGGTSFTNNVDIPASKNALWDFSLKDNSGLANTSYCLKIAYADGSDLEQYMNYPEIKTASIGLGLGFVDAGGSTVVLPAFPMQSANMLGFCQTTTTTLGSLGSTKLRVTQDGTTANGWSVSIAATGGDTSLWRSSDNSSFYDYNDSSGSPSGCNSGSDGDGYAGQLSFDTSKTVITPEAGCSANALSWDSGVAKYAAGTLEAITLLTASSSSSPNCYWDISDTGIAQTIPPNQPQGNYELQLTATVVAQ